MVEINTTEELLELVKQLKFLGVVQFKIGQIAMDLSGDALAPVAAETDEEEVLYYSA